MILFAKRLRETRKFRKLTQEELAEKANISRVMVTRYETEQVIPSLEVIISLADALNVSIDYLVGRTDSLGHFCENTQKLTLQPPNEPLIHLEKMPNDPQSLRDFILAILHEQGLL